MKPKTYVIDHGDDSFTIKIKKTLIVDQIPHQPPSSNVEHLPGTWCSLMGRVTYRSDRVLKFDFTIEKPPCFDDVLLEIIPAFDTSTIHVPFIIIDTITTCIKDYYNEFLTMSQQE